MLSWSLGSVAEWILLGAVVVIGIMLQRSMSVLRALARSQEQLSCDIREYQKQVLREQRLELAVEIRRILNNAENAVSRRLQELEANPEAFVKPSKTTTRMIQTYARELSFIRKVSYIPPRLLSVVSGVSHIFSEVPLEVEKRPADALMKFYKTFCDMVNHQDHVVEEWIEQQSRS